MTTCPRCHAPTTPPKCSNCGYENGASLQYAPAPAYRNHNPHIYSAPKKRRVWPWVLLGVFSVPALLIFAAVTFVLVSDLGAEYSPEQEWRESNGLYSAEQAVEYLDGFQVGADYFVDEKYSRAKTSFVETEIVANEAVARLSNECRSEYAAPDCRQLVKAWQSLASASNLLWKCSIDMQYGYDSGDCGDALDAMDGLEAHMGTVTRISTGWLQ